MTARPPLALALSHLRVLFVIAKHGPVTDAQIERRYFARTDLALPAGTLGWTPAASSSLRTRREELVGWGVVLEADRAGRTAAGRPSRRWEVASQLPLVLPPFEHPDRLRAGIDELLALAGSDVVVRAALTGALQAAGYRL